MTPDPLAIRIDQLARRLLIVERHLGLDAELPVEPIAKDEPTVAPRAFAVEKQITSHLLEKKHQARESAALEAESPGAPTKMPDSPAAPPTFPQPRPAAQKTTVPAKHRADPMSLERFVGGRLFAIVGAIVVTIGAGLFLKLAWDQGWMNLLPDALKCVLAAMFGAALLGVGEISRKKISAAASIGFSGAGIGVLYAAAFAAYGVFNLVSHEVGFALLVATSALGIAVGARAGLVSIAALSLIGGYLTPLLFLDVTPSPAVLPMYLFSLLLVGLVLCGWRGGRSALLRTLSWWGTILYGTVWMIATEWNHALIALVFIGAVWAAVHAELIYSAHRQRLSTPATGKSMFARWRAARPIASTFSTSSWATLVAAIAIDALGSATWMAPAAGCVALAMLSWPLGGHLRVLRDRPRNDTERLGAVFAVQSGALLIAAIALGTAGWLEIVAWLALGVSAVISGQWLRARGLDVYGLVVLTIATARLMMLEWWTTAVATPAFEVIGFQVSQWTALVACAALAWAVTGVLLRRSANASSRVQAATNFIFGLATTLLYAGLLHESLAMVNTIWLVLACAATLLGVGWFLSSRGLRVFSLIVHLGSVQLLISQAWWNADGTEILASTLGLIVTIWTPLVLAAGIFWCLAACAFTQSKSREWRTLGHIILAGGLALFALSIAHTHANWSVVTACWLGLSIAVFAMHNVVPRLELRRFAPPLAIFATVAWLAAFRLADWDLSTAPVALHPGLLLALLVAAVQYGLAKTAQVMHEDDAIGLWIGMCAKLVAATVVFTASSFEVARIAQQVTIDQSAQRAAVSIWWGVFAVGLLVGGFTRHHPFVRRAGLALLATATVKALVFDLVGVPPAWRVASFLILGLLMLGVGLVYARLAARRSAELANDTPPESTTG